MALAVAAKTGVEFDVANRVFFRLYQASNLMHKQGTRYVGPFGATTQQWAVLGALARPLVRDDGMMVKDLMEILTSGKSHSRPRQAGSKGMDQARQGQGRWPQQACSPDRGRQQEVDPNAGAHRSFLLCRPEHVQSR